MGEGDGIREGEVGEGGEGELHEEHQLHQHLPILLSLIALTSGHEKKSPKVHCSEANSIADLSKHLNGMSLAHSDAQQFHPHKRSDSDADCIDSLPLFLRLETKRNLETQETTRALLRTEFNHLHETCDVDNSTNLGSIQPSFIDPGHFTQGTQPPGSSGNSADSNSSFIRQSSLILGSAEAPIVID